MLKIIESTYYQVKKGQTILQIARAFCVAERLLVKENALTGEPFAGQILKIPKQRGNAYIAGAGDSKTLLCGSEENFLCKNGTTRLYIGMRVIL